jgi:hypothetical protein
LALAFKRRPGTVVATEVGMHQALSERLHHDIEGLKEQGL